MNISKPWNNHVAALERARKFIDEMASALPAAGTGRRIRKSLAEAWGQVMESTEEIDTLVTESVQPLPVDFPWRDKEFTDHWRLYKEYLQEQHGIAMRSRMEIARLKAIRAICNDDRQLFIRSVDAYMAVGATGIFSVNFESLHNKSTDDQQPKAIKISTKS